MRQVNACPNEEIEKRYLARLRAREDAAKAAALAGKDGAPENVPANKSFIAIDSSINPDEYLQIPGVDGAVIAIRQTYDGVHEKHKKGLNYEETHFALAENGLFMPSPAIFMPHFKNVVDAYKGKAKVLTASGKELPRDKVEELYNFMTSNYQVGNLKGVWTWLDAKFAEDNGNWKIFTNTRVKNGKLESDVFNLSCPIKEDCFVSLESNSQGMPALKYTTQKYKIGENIMFYYPRDGRVARFGADSDWADLSCYRDPADTDSELGVRACAAKI